jgi:hypothetical protein
MHQGWVTGKRAFVNWADQACKFLVVLRPDSGGTHFHYVVAIGQVDQMVKDILT